MYFYGQQSGHDSGYSIPVAKNEMFHAFDAKPAQQASETPAAPAPVTGHAPDSIDAIIEERVRKIVLFLGFNPKNKGFSMAVQGSIECYKNPLLLESMSKNFYPYLAEMFRSTPERVERCIRHELERCFFMDYLKNFNVLFQMHLWDEKQRMSNGVFFSLILQKLDMEFGVRGRHF